MHTKSQIVFVTFLLASFGLTFPINPVNSDLESRTAVAEASNLEISEVSPYLATRDPDDSELEARSVPDSEASNLEARDTPEIEPSDSVIHVTEHDDLIARANDPYHGKYAPSEATRKQELYNVHKGLSPDGKTGKQVAKQHGLPYDGDNGAREAAEVANGGPLPKVCGQGCLNSAYSKGSKV